MPFHRLKPRRIKTDPVHTPQCCVKVHSTTHSLKWRLERYARLRPSFDPLRCQQESVVMIGDEPYCTTHAAKLALDMWMKGELVEKKEE